MFNPLDGQWDEELVGSIFYQVHQEALCSEFSKQFIHDLLVLLSTNIWGPLIAGQVMLDTVGPELQVVNKSEAAISVEANGTVLTLTRARRPPPNCCPSTSLGLLMYTFSSLVLFI